MIRRLRRALRLYDALMKNDTRLLYEYFPHLRPPLPPAPPPAPVELPPSRRASLSVPPAPPRPPLPKIIMRQPVNLNDDLRESLTLIGISGLKVDVPIITELDGKIDEQPQPAAPPTLPEAPPAG